MPSSLWIDHKEAQTIRKTTNDTANRINYVNPDTDFTLLHIVLHIVASGATVSCAL